jgi:hypothetical protein
LGYPGEQAYVSGGTTVTGWTQNGDIWSASVRASNPYKFSYNGVQQTPARYPVGTWNPTNPEANWLYVQSATSSSFTFLSTDGLTSSNFGAGSLVVMHHGGCSGLYTVSSVNFSTYIASMSGSFNCDGNNFAAGDYYYVLNNAGDLTSPGQWFYNSGTQTLSYYPAASFSSSSLGVVSTVASAFIVSGSNITIQGLNFTDFAVPTADWGGDSTDGIPGVVDTSGSCSNLNVSNNNFYNVGRAIRLNPCSNSIVGNNIVSTTDSGAVSVQNSSSTNMITNNYIHDIGLIWAEPGAIHFTSAGGSNTVTHNAIWYTARHGIDSYHYQTTVTYGNSVFGYNDLEYNDIYGTDSASAYIEDYGSTSYQTLGRDSIEYNKSLYEEGRTANSSGVWSHGTSAFTFCYYLDDGTSGYNLVGNFCYNPTNAGLHFNGVNGGQGNDDLTIQNNLIVNLNSGGAVWSWTNGCGTNVIVTHNILDASESTSGSTCGAFSYNDYWNGATIQPGETNSIVADPQFTNWTNGDFSLQSTSPAFGIGYLELPWSLIGVQ